MSPPQWQGNFWPPRITSYSIHYTKLYEARGRYFRYEVKHPTIAQMAQYYRERKTGFVVFTVDHERGMGIKRISNEEVAESGEIPLNLISSPKARLGSHCRKGESGLMTTKLRKA